MKKFLCCILIALFITVNINTSFLVTTTPTKTSTPILRDIDGDGDADIIIVTNGTLKKQYLINAANEIEKSTKGKADVQIIVSTSVYAKKINATFIYKGKLASSYLKYGYSRIPGKTIIVSNDSYPVILSAIMYSSGIQSLAPKVLSTKFNVFKIAQNSLNYQTLLFTPSAPSLYKNDFEKYLVETFLENIAEAFTSSYDYTTASPTRPISSGRYCTKCYSPLGINDYCCPKCGSRITSSSYSIDNTYCRYCVSPMGVNDYCCPVCGAYK